MPDVNFSDCKVADPALADWGRKEIAIAQQMGITGVPCFIIENRYALVGAQSPTIIVEAIEKAAAERPAEAPAG